LTQQHALVLSAAALLQQHSYSANNIPQHGSGGSTLQQHDLQARLQQLLQLMAGSNAKEQWRCSVQQSAMLVLQQQQQVALGECSRYVSSCMLLCNCNQFASCSCFFAVGLFAAANVQLSSASRSSRSCKVDKPLHVYDLECQQLLAKYSKIQHHLLITSKLRSPSYIRYAAAACACCVAALPSRQLQLQLQYAAPLPSWLNNSSSGSRQHHCFSWLADRANSSTAAAAATAVAGAAATQEPAETQQPPAEDTHMQEQPAAAADCPADALQSRASDALRGKRMLQHAASSPKREWASASP
jgi:hypothetical protein